MIGKSNPRDEIAAHLPALRAFAISLTRQPALADDMVQDAIIKAWTNIETFKIGSNMHAWLFTILRNTYFSHRRRYSREVGEGGLAFEETLTQKPDHDGRLQLRDLWNALQRIPFEQREALILVGALGFTYDEAAETCGVALGTIKSRANRARKAMMVELGINEREAMELTDGVTLAVISKGPRSSM